MTTGVFGGEIYMTPLHNPGPKIGGRWKQRAIIFCGSRVIVIFVNSLPWQQESAGENLNDTIVKPRFENKRVGANSAQLSFTETVLYRFKISIGLMQNFATFEWLLWQQRSTGGKFK